MQEEVITYYNEVKKQNKRMLNEIKRNEKKQDREKLMKLLQVYVNFELLVNDYLESEIPSDS